MVPEAVSHFASELLIRPQHLQPTPPPFHLLVREVRWAGTQDPFLQCCKACTWTNLSLSNKIQRNCATVLSSFRHVQLFATPGMVAHQVPLTTGFLRQRILEWVAISSSKGSSQHRDQTHISYVSCTGRWFFFFFFFYHSCHLGSTKKLDETKNNCVCSWGKLWTKRYKKTKKFT